MIDTRVAIGHMNYPGDVRGILDEGPKGPNYLGEHMYPVDAVYDAEANRTRVGFSLIAPPPVITHD